MFLPSNISNQSTANNQNWLLPEDTEFVHGVHNAEEGVDRLGLLSDHGLVNGELELVVVEVLLYLSSVDVKDVGIHDGQGASPAFVEVGELGVLLVEYAIHEREVIFDLLVALNVEPVGGLVDGSLEIRHGCCEVVEGKGVGSVRGRMYAE